MVETLKTLLGTLLLLFRSRCQLQVEILVLRQQLIVLRRTAPKRVRLRAPDRLLAAQKAIDLTPNFALANYILGVIRVFLGRFDQVFDPIQRAMRLSRTNR